MIINVINKLERDGVFNIPGEFCVEGLFPAEDISLRYASWNI